MKIVIIALTVIFLLLTGSVPLACGPTEKGYKGFVVNEGVALFSFEYPVSFEEPDIDLVNGAPYSTLVISHRMAKGTEGVSRFAVIVSKTSSKFPNARAKLDYYVGLLQGGFSGGGMDPEYVAPNLQERVPIIVNGIQGEMIVWTCQWIPDFYPGTKRDAISRDVYFDWGGLIWEIGFVSHTDRAEQAKVEFEHLLETFQILD
jgi:hypothetical protein